MITGAQAAERIVWPFKSLSPTLIGTSDKILVKNGDWCENGQLHAIVAVVLSLNGWIYYQVTWKQPIES